MILFFTLVRKAKCYISTIAWPVINFNQAMVFVYDFFDDGKTEPGTEPDLFCGVKRLENVGKSIRINSPAGITDINGQEGRVVYAPFRPEALHAATPRYTTAHAAASAADPWDGRPSREAAFIERIRAVVPQHEVRNLDPILDEMRETFDGQLGVEFIDVRRDRDAGRAHRVRVIPTQVFYDPEGNELFRHQGFYSRENILGKWRELGFEFEG